MISLKNNSVSIISFFFNEADNINAFIKKAYNLINNAKRFGIKVVFIVIDDGSYDGSYEKIKKLKFNGIKIFRNKKNMGVAYSFAKGIRLSKSEIIFHQTLDWSYDLRNFKKWFFLLKTYDLVIGYREKNKIRSDNFLKKVISYGNYFLIKILFPSNIRDVQNLFFCRRKNFKFLKFKSSFFTFKTYLRMYEKNKKIIQVPINFIPRKKGKSKGTQLKFILHQIIDILSFFCKDGWKISYNLYFVKKFKVDTI